MLLYPYETPPFPFTLRFNEPRLATSPQLFGNFFIIPQSYSQAHIALCPVSTDLTLEFILEGAYQYTEQFETTPNVLYHPKNLNNLQEISL